MAKKQLEYVFPDYLSSIYGPDDLICITVERNGVKVVMSADQKVVKLEIDGEERKDIVEILKDAHKESQKVAAKKLQEMGGGLGGLLGGR